MLRVRLCVLDVVGVAKAAAVRAPVGAEVVAMSVDVSGAVAVEAAVEVDVSRVGRLDGAVDQAGIASPVAVLVDVVDGGASA